MDWTGVLIDKNLSIKPLGTSSDLKVFEKQTGIEITNKVPLLEENVETLTVASFQHIFGGMDPMLLTRQRALYQVADLIAIDGTGRISIFELKSKPVKTADILSQATQYLIESGNLTPDQIANQYERYNRESVFRNKIYHAGLLERRRAESVPGMRPYLIDSKWLTETEKKDLNKFSNKGGEEYFQLMADLCEKYILSENGIDVKGAHTKLSHQGYGGAHQPPVHFKTAFNNRFDLNPDLLDINRQWRIIYFAPSYSFQNGSKKNETELTHFLSEMYLRGLDVRFYEFRLQPLKPPWLFCWRETREWLNETTLRKLPKKTDLALKWKQVEKETDLFIKEAVKRGYLFKKWPGNYECWNLVKPFIPEVFLTWPEELPHLQKGSLKLKKSLDTHLIEPMALITSRPDIALDVVAKGNSIRWEIKTGLDNLDCAMVTAEIISNLLNILH